MKMTLLEMTQDILNDLDADEVNNLDDTIESQQVAQIIKTCFYEMIGNRNWPHLRKLVQLEASGDINKPNYLRLPVNIKELAFFKYECRKENQTRSVLKDIKYKYPDEFLRMVSGRNNDLDTVNTVTDFSGTSLLILNNIAPSYWTSFDDLYLVTDSYDQTVDSTLQKSKNQCFVDTIPEWDRRNEAYPNLPAEAFPALLAEAKSTAFLAIKQMINQKAEQKASRQQRWLSRKAWKAHGGVRYENYGRNSRK